MQNFVKIRHKRYHVRFFRLLRWPPSAILDFQIFKHFVTHQVGMANMCIALPNFIKIGQTVAEISHLTFFKMVAVRYLRFFFK